MKDFFNQFSSAVIALSGGADSACVLKLAVENSRNPRDISAATCIDRHIFRHEINNASQIAKYFGIKWYPFTTPLDIFDISYKNERCYLCKSQIISSISKLKCSLKADVIFDGTNIDDLNEERQGLKALKEYGVISPLVELNLGKDFVNKQVNELKGLNIKFVDNSCLLTRFTDGVDSLDEIELVEKIEDALRNYYPSIRVKPKEKRLNITSKSEYKFTATDKQNISIIIKNLAPDKKPYFN